MSTNWQSKEITRRRSLMAFALTVIFMLLGATLTSADHSAGSLDTGFGDGGKLLVESPPFSQLAGIAIQPDGKFVVAGGDIDHMLAARFNRDGSPDLGFGVNGSLTIEPGGNFYPGALALQPDRKILIAGARRRAYEDADFLLARLNSDGSLDESFGTNGFAVVDFDDGSDSVAAIGLLARGKIVVTGSTVGNPPRLNFAVAQFLSDGQLDSTFGNQGKITTAIGYDSIAGAMLIAPDGKIIVGGAAITGAVSLYDLALVRYDKKGNLDPSFGNSGIVITDWETNDGAAALAWGPNGTIIVAGNGRTLLARYNSDGSLDVSFGLNGTVQLAPMPIAYPTAMALQPNGQILLIGTYTLGDAADFTVLRFNPDGSQDNQFGSDGMAVVGFGLRRDYPSDVAVRPNGGILVVGLSHEYIGGVYMGTELALAAFRGR